MNILKTIVLFVVLLGNSYWNTHSHSFYFPTPKFSTSPIPNFTHSPIHSFFTDSSIPSFTCLDPSIASPFLHLPTLTPFPADTLNCQATVTFSIGYSDTCTADTFTLRTALDFDIQATDENTPPTLADFIADEPDANTYFVPSDTGFLFQGDFPIGTHGLHIDVEDACGDRVEELLIFEVVDVAIPEPLCINDIRIELLPTAPNDADADGDGDDDLAAAIVAAIDLITTPIYDCTGQGELNELGLRQIMQYSINLQGAEAHPEKDSLILTCDNDLTTIVEIHAWDQERNSRYCESKILVPDPLSRCGYEYIQVAGNIQTTQSEGLPGVEVQLSGQDDDRYYQTRNDGYYQFIIYTDGAYTITPSRNDSWLEGVSTLDIILLSRHILGISVFRSPYQYLAADCNNDSMITIQDIIEIRQNILGVKTGFTNNTSWRFVTDDHSYPQPTNPWLEPLPESKYLASVLGYEEVDFIAIKIGDIDDSFD